jgi:hypothetical protein
MMKRCPKCNQEYSDASLEFCLEDGTRLVSQVATLTSEPTVVLPNIPTVNYPTDVKTSPIEESAKTTKVQELKVKAVDQGNKILEIVPIVFALTHNYWQWLYAIDYRYSSFSDYFLSSSFIVWFLLLISTLILGVTALKLVKHKGFAITSLIILAINFLLFIVPHR